MALKSKTFRIFVSSTFSDLKEERNALQEKVFPELRKLCMEHGFRFQAIDLRWGVSKEASLSQETMRICLQEIKRCQGVQGVTPKPNFIILLGDRYGWQPIPEEIPGDELNQIKEVIKKHRKDFDVIAEELSGLNAEELLDNWYREDKNAVPPAYILQPVDPESKYADSELWDKEVQQPLLNILRKAVQYLGLSNEEKLKYEASATHQEVELGAMKVDDADEHVFGLFRQIKNIDELKKEDLSEPPAQDFVDTNIEDEFDEASHEKLTSLKERLREKLGKDNIFAYDAEWEENGITTSHLNKLCKDVYDNLSRIIRKQIDQLDEKKPLEKEIEAHEDFREDRAKHFIGRPEILGKIKRYIKKKNNHPLAIHGKSGTGKSALLAFAVKRANEDFPNAAIVFRSIGATPTSSDGRFLLESLCRQVSKICEADETNIPGDYKELIEEFPKCLALATKGKPLILFIDALDQLSDGNDARNLTWLPPGLPANVKLIVSTLPGECYEALKKKLPENVLRELKPMLPKEGEKLLKIWLDDASRVLKPHQHKEILNNFNRGDNGNPLYLKLAFEEARRWKSYTKEEETKLSPDISGIIQNLFRRLSLKENHGEMIVSRSLGYLAAAKNGLSEDELLEVLSRDEEFFQDFLDRAFHKPPENRLPVIVWSRLYFDLEPYLIERDADGASLMAFYHPTTFGAKVKEEYLSGKTKIQHHQRLADYFEKQKLYNESDDKTTPNLRKLSELPFQQTYGNIWDELYNTLTDIEFLEQKNTHFIVYDLLDDYRTTLAKNMMPQEGEVGKQRIVLHVFSKVLDQASFVLKENPEQTFPQIYNRLRWQAEEDETLKKKLEFEQDHYTKPWLRLQSKPAQSKNLIRTFSGHTDFVYTCAFSPDGRRIVSGSGDKTFKMWDTESGEELFTFRDHTDKVNACTFSPDGRLIASCSDDKTIILWEAETYKKHKTLKGHIGAIKTCSFSSDGKRIVSGGGFEDNTLKVWNVKTGWKLGTPKGHFGSINACAFSSNGKLIVSGGHNELRLWEVASGKELAAVGTNVEDCAFSPVRKHIVIAGGLFSLHIWDIERKEIFGEMDIPGDYDDDYHVRACAYSPSGQQIVSGVNEELRLWDAETCKELGIFKGHSSIVEACAYSPDGKYILSASRDKTLKLWNSEPRDEFADFKGHSNWVGCCKFSPDGKKILSSGAGSTNSEVLLLWDAESKQNLAIFEDFMWSDDCAFSPDGELIFSTNKTGLIIRDVKSKKKIMTFRDSESVFSCILSPDGKLVVSAGNSGELILWNTKSGKKQKILKGHNERLYDCDFSPDGRFIVSGGMDKLLKLWNVETGEEIATLRGHIGKINSCSFSPDGQFVVSGGGVKDPDPNKSFGELKLWNINRGKEPTDLIGHTEVIVTCAFSPDGRTIVSGSEDETLKIWDVKTVEELFAFKGFTSTVTTCTFNPDGTHIVVGDNNGQILLLSLENF